MENLTVGFGNFRVQSSPQILWMPTALGSPESVRSGDTSKVPLSYSLLSAAEKQDFDPVPQDDSPGDLNDANYSTRLDEILDGDEGDPSYADGGRSPSDGEDEEGFFYTGNDAPKVLGYAAQLADVLDEDEAQAAEEAEEELQIQAELEEQSQDDDVFDYSKFKVCCIPQYPNVAFIISCRMRCCRIGRPLPSGFLCLKYPSFPTIHHRIIYERHIFIPPFLAFVRSFLSIVLAFHLPPLLKLFLVMDFPQIPPTSPQYLEYHPPQISMNFIMGVQPNLYLFLSMAWLLYIALLLVRSSGGPLCDV
jgi:hypothetical protein